MTEHDLMKQIQLEVTNLGGRVFRNNVGRLPDNKGRWVQYGLCVGSGDLIGWWKGGVFLCIEIKVGKKQPTKEQQNFINEVNNVGGIAFVARSIEDVYTHLK